MPQLIITEGNWRDQVEQARRRDQGVSLLPPRYAYGEMPGVPRFRDVVQPIPRADWGKWIEAITADGAWSNDVRRRNGGKVKDQNGYGYCWAYAATEAVEDARLAAGVPWEELAPESLGGAVGWVNEGNTLDSCLAYMKAHGIASRPFIPYLQDKKPHPSNFKAGWEEDGKKHIPLEWYDVGSKEEAVTALCLGYSLYVGLLWWSHAIKVGKLRMSGNKIDWEFLQSWGESYGEDGFAWLDEEKGNPTTQWGCYAFRVVTWEDIAKRLPYKVVRIDERPSGLLVPTLVA